MIQAICIHQTGGPEILKWETVEPGKPNIGETRIRQTAIGLNYIDIYYRTGLYPLPSLPIVLGLEGAGIVEEVGVGVTEVKVGDRVAYAGGPLGAYAEERLIPADRLVLLPDGISDVEAAGMMLKGLTAQYLLRRTYSLNSGETILVHAAAGGVGSLLCQWANYLGATVIGTVSSDQKAEHAKANGCKHTIVYTRENFSERVKQLTEGIGVPVVYDGVGKDTFLESLNCLSPFGLMVSFGNASGKVPLFDIGILSAKGSLFLTRPTLMDYTAKRADLQSSAKDLFDVVLCGAVKVDVQHTYALKDAAMAHRDLEARRITGSVVLLP
jgi:NADPH:quinone reductase